MAGERGSALLMMDQSATDRRNTYITGSERADGFVTGLTVAAVLMAVAVLIGWVLGRLA